MEGPRSKPIRSSQELVLSLILCSRNDRYQGDSVWRLQTTLNYVARNLVELGKQEDVEVIVADWGSEAPLRDVLHLTPAAAEITWFVHIPPDIAKATQKDSPFSEVHALNAAARRSRGQYIGRIDQDTLVGKQFLETFFQLFAGTRCFDKPLEHTIIWANRLGIPYRFAVRCPSLRQVDQYIRWFGRSLPIDFPGPQKCFFDAPVGIWLVPRAGWEDCGGYNERMIYWGHMEIDMVYRLMQKYTLVHLDNHMDCDFYHLEHYHPLIVRETNRRRNPNRYDDLTYYPNDENWGLFQYPLALLPTVPQNASSGLPGQRSPNLEWPLFMLLLLTARMQTMSDSLIIGSRRAKQLALKSWLSFSRIWNRRAKVAWCAVRGQPLISWPRLLINRWNQRGVLHNK
jgi:hypothetical protein